MAGYKQDPNDSTKQVPSSPFGSAYQNVTKTTLPPPEVVQKRPNYVIVGNDGTYAFLYETSGSIGSTVSAADKANGSGGKWVTGSMLIDANQGPVELPIQPVAWRLTSGDGSSQGVVGDITFVYRGGA